MNSLTIASNQCTGYDNLQVTTATVLLLCATQANWWNAAKQKTTNKLHLQSVVAWPQNKHATHSWRTKYRPGRVNNTSLHAAAFFNSHFFIIFLHLNNQFSETNTSPYLSNAYFYVNGPMLHITAIIASASLSHPPLNRPLYRNTHNSKDKTLQHTNRNTIKIP